MKKIAKAIVSLLLLAAPVAVSAAASVPSAIQDKKPRQVAEVAYSVNMHCRNCVAKLTDNLSYLKGVEDLSISLEDKTVAIKYNPAKTDEKALAKAIEKCGYKASKIEKPVPKGRQ